MLDNIRIFTNDPIWRRIVAGLGGVVCDDAASADVDLDALGLNTVMRPVELKAAILNAMDNRPILRRIFGRDVALSAVQARIVTLLHQSGGMRANQLRVAMGYAPDATTHTIDTAIYQMRRAFGRDFIKNDDGVYRLGQL